MMRLKCIDSCIQSDTVTIKTHSVVFDICGRINPIHYAMGNYSSLWPASSYLAAILHSMYNRNLYREDE